MKTGKKRKMGDEVIDLGEDELLEPCVSLRPEKTRLDAKHFGRGSVGEGI